MSKLEHAPLLEAPPRPEPAPPVPYRLSSVPKKMSLSRPHQLLQLACRAVGASLGGLGLLSAGGDLVEHFAFGVGEEAGAEAGRSPAVTHLIRYTLGQPGPVCLEDLGATPGLEVPAPLAGAGPFLSLALHCPGRCRGALYLARPRGSARFATRELETVEPIRAWLEQGNLYEEAHLLSRLHLLNRVAQAAASNLELRVILDRALRELDRHFPLHPNLIWLTGGGPAGRLTLAAASPVPAAGGDVLGLHAGMELEADETPFAGCLADGQGLYVDVGDPVPAAGASGSNGPSSATPETSRLARQLAAHGATCFFVAPLRAGDQTLGLLQSVCTRPSGFTSEQIQLLYLVADLLGPAISNCRLFERLKSTCEELRATQTQLVRVEKMKALGELASGMAHDFNNSLCGVLGFLELALTDRSLSPGGRGCLESARTCALDAAQTVRRVQDFARFRRHKSEFQTLDVNDLLDQTVELTRPKWEGLDRLQGGPIMVEIRAEAKARILGSAAELREALTNLVFNAVDAMPHGGTLRLLSWSTPQEVFLAVQDTGVGMSLEVRQRLFEPFFTTKGEKGNGLGLSMVFGIVQAHGGEISVASEAGRGTTFTIRLPASRAKEDGSAVRSTMLAAPGQAPAPPPARPAALRVLVVEDEESIREFLERVLSHLGHRPRLAADAREGLAAFRSDAFDVVITDLGLPGTSGEELARTIAQLSPETPVILLTGWADQLQTEGKELPGVSRILGKPLSISALSEALDSLRPRG